MPYMIPKWKVTLKDSEGKMILEISSLRRPSGWYRLWHRVLFGITWEKIPDEEGRIMSMGEWVSCSDNSGRHS